MNLWQLMHPDATVEMLGWLPDIFDNADPRPAVEQVNDRYAHGGGWQAMAPTSWRIRPDASAIVYPGSPGQEGEPEEPDEAYPLLAQLRLHDEMIRLYLGSWVTITQPDGSVELSRMD